MPDLQKHTLNLRAGDYEWLMDTYAAKDVTASMVIRMIVSKFVDNLKNKHEKIAEALINLEGIE